MFLELESLRTDREYTCREVLKYSNAITASPRLTYYFSLEIAVHARPLEIKWYFCSSLLIYRINKCGLVSRVGTLNRPGYYGSLISQHYIYYNYILIYIKYISNTFCLYFILKLTFPTQRLNFACLFSIYFIAFIFSSEVFVEIMLMSVGFCLYINEIFSLHHLY